MKEMRTWTRVIAVVIILGLSLTGCSSFRSYLRDVNGCDARVEYLKMWGIAYAPEEGEKKTPNP